MTQQEFFNRFVYSVKKDKLGGGSFGKVYKAYDKTLDKYVAIKVAEQLEIGNKTFSLKDEFDALAKLQVHPNIAKYEELYTFESPQGIFDYAIMQYYPDGNLSQLIHNQNLTDEQKESVALQLLEGIDFLHQHQVVHRDLKPSNILIHNRTLSGQLEYIPKITDFGLSKKANTDQNTHFTNSFAAGTYAYSSPEQLKGETLRFNTDFWAYGAIVYEVFTGKKLFHIERTTFGSSAMDIKEILDNILKSDISSKIKELPEKWQPAILACLERDSRKRVMTAAEIREILDGNAQKAEEDNDTVLLKEKQEDKTKILEPELPVSPKDDPKTKKTNPLLYVIPLAVVLIGGLMYFLLKGKEEVQPESITPVAVNYTVFEEDGLYGYKEGDSIVITPKFTEVNPFTDGRALVKTIDSIYYINNTGKLTEFVSLIPGVIAKNDAEIPTEQKLEETKKEEPIKEETKPNIDSPYLPEMVRVSGGTFIMGCTDEQGSDCYSDERPAHKVKLSSFSIGKYPITVAQYRYFCKQTGIKMPNEPSWGWQDNHPMIRVSWYDVQKYIKWLSKKTGKNYRLPTEAEWEFAARGGNHNKGYKYAGGNILSSVGWYSSNSGSKTHEVGQKRANELGLYDMAGNAWEWCNDWYGGYSSGSQTNPKGPSSGSRRVLRGGGWGSGAVMSRVAFRSGSSPDSSYNSDGFRVVLSQ